MPARTATNIKFTSEERAQIADLGKSWGTTSCPLPMADVVRRAIDLAHKAESSSGNGKKTSKKSWSLC